MLSPADWVGWTMLAGLSIAFVVLMVQGLLAERRHRRVTQRLAEALLAAEAIDDGGCDWHEQGGYGFVWTCPRCKRTRDQT